MTLNNVCTDHERIPWHGVEELIEQIGKTQLINNPVITIHVNDGFVKIKNHHNSTSCSGDGGH